MKLNNLKKQYVKASLFALFCAVFSVFAGVSAKAFDKVPGKADFRSNPVVVNGDLGVYIKAINKTFSQGSHWYFASGELQIWFWGDYDLHIDCFSYNLASTSLYINYKKFSILDFQDIDSQNITIRNSKFSRNSENLVELENGDFFDGICVREVTITPTKQTVAAQL